MRRNLLLSTALLASLSLAPALLAPPAAADTPKNALGALAVSPDGTTLAAAGDNRVLYLVDPATLEVRERLYIGTNPLDLFYSADGKTLALHSTDDDIILLSTETWQPTGKVEDVQLLAHAAAADALVVLGRAKKQSDGSYLAPLSVISLADGSVALSGGVAGNAAALASRPDASGFAVLTKQVDDPDEPKEEPPAETKGFDKDIFKQQHDAKSSEIILIGADGAETGRTKTWYGTGSTLTGIWDGEAVHFVGYSNDNLTVSAAGETVAMFEGPVSYNYGMGIAPDQTRIAVGSLRDGGVVTLADGSSAGFKLDAEAGWPEYFEGFTFAPDGSIYGGTSAYRLVHVAPDGTLQKVVPIY